MFAAQGGAEACVRRLLLAAANVNATDEDFWSPLHFAAKEGHLEVCSLLLKGRSNPLMVNCDEKTPLELAKAEDVRFAHEMARVMEREGDSWYQGCDRPEVCHQAPPVSGPLPVEDCCRDGINVKKN